MIDASPQIANDSLLAGRIALRQPVKGHRAGTDAVLLAAAAPNIKGLLIDAGASTGAVGLMAARGDIEAEIVFIERNEFLVDLCRHNIESNGFTHAKAVAVNLLDTKALAANDIRSGIADAVVTNPPFLEPGRSRPSPDTGKAAAHVLTDGSLRDWIKACARLLKPKGILTLIHRAERLGDIFDGFGQGLGNIRMRGIHPRVDEPAIRIVVRAIKGGKGPLRIDPPLILHDTAGRFTPEAAALHDGSSLFLFDTD